MMAPYRRPAGSAAAIRAAATDTVTCHHGHLGLGTSDSVNILHFLLNLRAILLSSRWSGLARTG